MYTIMQLSQLAGVSTRTLRYYDEINLLQPSNVTEAGYRLYDEAALDKLQHILFYKALGFSLKEIKSSLEHPQFDELAVLHQHYETLLDKQMQLESLIKTVKTTIEAKKGRAVMTAKDKFEGLKDAMLEENEAQYGEELKSSYDEEFYAKSQEKFKKMSKWQFETARTLEKEIIDDLVLLVGTKLPTSEEALQLAAKHKEWLMYYWPTYSKEAHAGLGEMYVADERFTHYYDKHKEGAAQFLCDAIAAYTAQ